MSGALRRAPPWIYGWQHLFRDGRPERRVRYANERPVRQTERMSVVAVPVVGGRNGRLYPVGHRRPDEDNARAAGLIHAMRHRGMPFRTIAARLADHGLRVSLGSVHHLWRSFECDRCA